MAIKTKLKYLKLLAVLPRAAFRDHTLSLLNNSWMQHRSTNLSTTLAKAINSGLVFFVEKAYPVLSVCYAEVNYKLQTSNPNTATIWGGWLASYSSFPGSCNNQTASDTHMCRKLTSNLLMLVFFCTLRDLVADLL